MIARPHSDDEVGSMSDIVEGRIAVPLDGDQIDLNDVCAFFSKGLAGVKIERITIPPNERVVLLSEELNDLEDEGQRYRAAGRILEQINGILFLNDPNRKPLPLAGAMHRQSANGNWGVTVVLGGLHARGRAGMIAFTSRPDAPSKQEQLFKIAQENDDAQKLLTHLRDVPDWTDLYNAFEIMRENIKKRFGNNLPMGIDWPDKKALAPFTGDAQFFRHSHLYKNRPKRDMSTAMPISDARQFVRMLCTKWLSSF
jgi:hypothetical protein